MTMARGPSSDVVRNARFVGALLPAFLLLFGFMAVVGVVSTRLHGMLGVLVGILAGGCLALGLLLGYWIAADWLNLRVIRRTGRPDASAFRDGEVVAFEGVVRVDGEPMTAPFSRTACAAYTYVVAGSRYSAVGRRSQRYVLAQGFHMARTTIEGTTHSLRLLSLPGFEDDLRENAPGIRREAETRELFARISGNAASAGERERHSRLLEARRSAIDAVDHDYCMAPMPERVDGLVVDEEVLPAGQTVCVVGTYDAKRDGLTARRFRLGPDLIVYRGGAKEVLSRVGKETAGFARMAGVLTAAGALLVAFPFLPAAWTSGIPVVGPAIVRPSPPVEQASDIEAPEAAADLARRARIDGWVREEYLAGNQGRALELAVDEDAHDSLRWLIEQGVGPATRMRVDGDEYQVPLVEAARNGYVETVRTLLEAGADPNQVQPARSQPETGQTALGESLKLGHCETAELLVEFGATPPPGLETSRCPADAQQPPAATQP